MGESELKKALQREGEAQVSDFWQGAETQVAAKRQEIETKVEQLRAETERRVQTEIITLRNNLLFEAQTRAMASRLCAEAELEKRLLSLAYQLLPELASNNREALWKALREELPASSWTDLKVHPADRKLAEHDFPTARIACDELLGGGLVVNSAENTIRIDNSLHCRLLRAWPDLLPKLLDELRKLVDKDETTGSDTTR